MPKLDLTNNEIDYLTGLLFDNRVSENSYASRQERAARQKGNKSKAELLCELEQNLYTKVINANLDGFKG